MMTKREIRDTRIQKRPSSRGYRCHVDPKWRDEYRRRQSERDAGGSPYSTPAPFDWKPFLNGLCLVIGMFLGILAIGLIVLTAGNWQPARRCR